MILPCVGPLVDTKARSLLANQPVETNLYRVLFLFFLFIQEDIIFMRKFLLSEVRDIYRDELFYCVVVGSNYA